MEQEIIKSERKLRGFEEKKFQCCKKKKKLNSVGNEEKVEGAEEIVNYSLFIFSSKGTLRKSISNFVYNKKFEFIMIFIIIMSSILLALDDPLSNE